MKSSADRGLPAMAITRVVWLASKATSLKLRSKDLVCTLHSKNAPHLPKMHPFQKCTRLSEKCTLLFWKCTLKNQKCTRAFSLGAFFYQNMSTKPTERQGYVPTQIIEKREILTVRVSLSHFSPTLIRQLPSHFCFKTLLWVLAQPLSPLFHCQTLHIRRSKNWTGPSSCEG